MAIIAVKQPIKSPKQLGARKGQTGTEEYNYVLSVIFPSSMLHILPYHRLIRDLGGLTAEDFLKKVSVSFDVEDLTRPAEPSVPHTFCLYLAANGGVSRPKKARMMPLTPLRA